MTTLHRSPTRRRRNLSNDDGSMLLAILFTLMITALVLVVTASVLAGLAKTRASRDYAIALQAADAAFANATMTANMQPSKFTNLPKCTVALASCPANTKLTYPTTPAALGSGTVKWQWTATRTGDRTWDLAVQAVGKNMDRHFTSTLKGTQVNGGILNTNTDELRYLVSGTQNYEFGFYGNDSFTVANTSPVSIPDFDGYNGEVGTVGSAGTLSLGNATMTRIAEWNWTSDSGRCTGTYCPATNGGLGYAEMKRYPTKPTFSTSAITAACATSDGAWKTSTNGTVPLVAGHCYDSLTFDSNAPIPPIKGIIYVKTGGVTVNTGVTVGAAGNISTAPSSNLRIATLGNFSQAINSRIAMGVFAPNGSCNVNANTGVATNPATQTIWLGAATCKTFTVTGSARFRYDGNLALVNDDPNTSATNRWIWSVYDYVSVD